ASATRLIVEFWNSSRKYMYTGSGDGWRFSLMKADNMCLVGSLSTLSYIFQIEPALTISKCQLKTLLGYKANLIGSTISKVFPVMEPFYGTESIPSYVLTERISNAKRCANI